MVPTVIDRLLRSASGRRAAAVSSTIEASESWSIARSTRPDSTLARSSTSLIRPSRCFPLTKTCSIHSAGTRRWSPSGCSPRISSLNPMIALSGVRSSWLIAERKSLLAWLAALNARTDADRSAARRTCAWREAPRSASSAACPPSSPSSRTSSSSNSTRNRLNRINAPRAEPGVRSGTAVRKRVPVRAVTAAQSKLRSSRDTGTGWARRTSSSSASAAHSSAGSSPVPNWATARACSPAVSRTTTASAPLTRPTICAYRPQVSSGSSVAGASSNCRPTASAAVADQIPRSQRGGRKASR